MGKNEPGRKGSKKKKGIKKDNGTSERKRKKKNQIPPRWIRTAIGVHTNGWPQNKKIGWCVGGCWITPALH